MCEEEEEEEEEEGDIVLTNVKAKYYIDDIYLVDIRDLNYANESRLYFEIFFSLGVCLLGVTISSFNWYLLSGTLLFILLGFFFLIRFLFKYNSLLRKSKSKKEQIIENLITRYPKDKNGRTFQLIESDEKPGRIYLLDHKTNIKHHIGSYSTFVTLGLKGAFIKRLNSGEFNSIKEGNKILID